MAELNEHQFEIMYGSNSQNGYVFGIGAPLSVEQGGFHPGEANWITQDTTNQRRGNLQFGRDARGNKSWTWDAFTNAEDTAGALEILNDIASVWGMDTVYGKAQETQRLRYKVGGRTRCIFGRPRKLSTTPNNSILGGLMQVGLEFVAIDGNTYSDAEHVINVGYNSDADGGGIIFPVVFPLQTLPSTGYGEGMGYVDGNTKTYPIIRFYGPWSDPSITCNEWTLKWNGTVPEGTYVAIDTRPWKQTVTMDGKGSVVSGLSANTWLEDCYLLPGVNGFRMGGVATSGAARAEVVYRDAWTEW